MLKLHYQIHLLLHSKYKVFINFFIIISIYFFLRNDNYIFCMTEDNTLPTIAESKTIAEANLENKKMVSKEISCAISSLSEKIAEQRDEILDLKAKIRYLNMENQSMLDRMYGNDDPDEDNDNPPLFFNRLFWGNLYDEEDDF